MVQVTPNCKIIHRPWSFSMHEYPWECLVEKFPHFNQYSIILMQTRKYIGSTMIRDFNCTIMQHESSEL